MFSLLPSSSISRFDHRIRCGAENAYAERFALSGDGRHTAPSNEQFDAWLRSQNNAWGVRDVSEVADLAAENGFVLTETVPMPANNFSVVFRRWEQL